MESGCQHYQRRCLLVAPCCGETFWCRHCHNTAKHDDEPNPNLKHFLNRKAVEEVICAACRYRQPVGASCTNCGISFGRYFCLECRFFDDDITKRQFHCDQCGICRVGGRENFFHCQTCNCCYHIDMQNRHRCIPNSMHNNCPICQDFLFDSVKDITVLTCGHTIHALCLRQLTEHQIYRCPVCFRSVCDMTDKWKQLDRMVATTPMPSKENRRASIICHDCHRRSTVNYHYYGLKCAHCGGYNTLLCNLSNH